MSPIGFEQMRSKLVSFYGAKSERIERLLADERAMADWRAELRFFDDVDLMEGVRAMVHQGVEVLTLPVLLARVRTAKNDRLRDTPSIPGSTEVAIDLDTWERKLVDEAVAYATAYGLEEPNWLPKRIIEIRTVGPFQERMEALLAGTATGTTRQFLATVAGDGHGTRARRGEAERLGDIIGAKVTPGPLDRPLEERAREIADRWLVDRTSVNPDDLSLELRAAVRRLILEAATPLQPDDVITTAPA